MSSKFWRRVRRVLHVMNVIGHIGNMIKKIINKHKEVKDECESEEEVSSKTQSKGRCS